MNKCIENTTHGFPQIQPFSARCRDRRLERLEHHAGRGRWSMWNLSALAAWHPPRSKWKGGSQRSQGWLERSSQFKSCQVEVCRNLFFGIFFRNLFSESPVGLQIVVISLRCIFHKNMQLGFLCVSACRQHGCPALPPSHWLEDWTTMDKFDQVLGYNRIQNTPRMIIQSYHIISYCYILYTIASHLWQSSVLAPRCALYSLSFSPAGSSPTWLGFSTMSAGKSPWINHNF